MIESALMPSHKSDRACQGALIVRTIGIFQTSAPNESVFVGVDVHGSVKKPFFVAVLSYGVKGSARLGCVERLNGVDKTVDFIVGINPCVIAIDAPQPLCDEAHNVPFEESFKACKRWQGLRECERQLIRCLNIRCFPTTPTTFGSFKKLIRTGWELYAELMRHSYRIANGECNDRHGRWLIEVYPHATFAMLSHEKLLPKTKAVGRMQRVRILERYIPDIAKHFKKMLPCADELDSIAAALTAFLWWRGDCIVLGSPSEGGCLIIPKAKALLI